ncbi:MAG: PAS domain S-box protein [Clostridia bacterium]|nr:PAS domain S-box protein [Clostridia bacterium]
METVGLLTSCISILILMFYLISRKKKNQLQKIFIVNCILIFCWCILLVAQKHFCATTNINPIKFDYFIYICICFLPVSIFFTGLIFANTKIEFKKRYLLLFIVPVLSLVMLWTNDYHHLFYANYSTDMSKTVFGNYFYIHNTYTLILYFIGLFYLLKYSIKNSGIFSKQAILFSLAALVPILINILGAFQIVPISIYLTPISFSVTILLCGLAVSKFKLLTVTPIALQRIVDRMSDSYLVLDEENKITDFNETFLKTFGLKDSTVRNTNIFDLIDSFNKNLLNEDSLNEALQSVKNSTKTIHYDKYFSQFDKYFRIEINAITSKQRFIGTLILFKDTTQHEEDMQTIKNNQDMLMENERLASLGQLIGGIAHNLKTPIMSIAGAAEGLNDLIKEYDSSIDDPEVNSQDHHDIAKDMSIWVEKIKEYTEYMSDIITTVKGQAVTLATDEEIEFTIEELIKRVDILMKHELKNAIVYLNISMRTDEKITIHGDANSLVQVINNMISNSIQAYNGKPNQNIDMIFYLDEGNLVISIRDYAGGLPKKVQEKLFKEMITTKGKNGTGLGLYMSYSNIKARFNGDITYQTNNEGTTFNIILPL